MSASCDSVSKAWSSSTQPPAQPSRVFFGAWVTLEDEAGEEVEYRIVGPDEFDAATGYISMDSPLGRALHAQGARR